MYVKGQIGNYSTEELLGKVNKHTPSGFPCCCLTFPVLITCTHTKDYVTYVHDTECKNQVVLVYMSVGYKNTTMKYLKDINTRILCI